MRRKKNTCARIAIVAETASDARDVVVDGISGILATSPPWDKPHYEPSKRRVTWKNGAYATLYSGDKPDQLRGPQHEAAWIDEFAKFRYAEELWYQLKYGMRTGRLPQILITTTPRPITILRRIMAHSRTVITGGSTFDNEANLSEEWVHDMLDTFAGTTLGQQELYAALLDEAKGALWKRKMLEMLRVDKDQPQYRSTVIGIDPATTSKRKSAMTGIIAVSKGLDGHGYVRGDASGRHTPIEWAQKAVDMFKDLDGDEIVAEGNQGGDMVAQTIKTVDANIPVRVVHARTSKQARAEPIVSLYEQGRFHHVGMFAALEDQMVTWEPESGDESPDRVDALVWAARRLFISGAPKPGLAAPKVMEDNG